MDHEYSRTSSTVCSNPTIESIYLAQAELGEEGGTYPPSPPIFLLKKFRGYWLEEGKIKKWSGLGKEMYVQGMIQTNLLSF
jgi:hypothetical protein